MSVIPTLEHPPAARQQATEAPGKRAWSPRSVLILLLSWTILQFSGIFSPGLLDDVDSVYTECAREMLTRGDFITPYVNGIRFFDKPPLLYWMVAGSMRVFGIHDWAARIPIALVVLALVLAIYALGVRLFRERGGFYSALIVSTSLGTYLFTRFLIPDIMLALWMTLSVHAFLTVLDRLRERRNAAKAGVVASRWRTILPCWAFAVVMALNVLTKGLIGLVFPVAVVLGYLIWTGQLKRLRQMHLLSSSVVFLAIAAPWHVLVALANPAVGAARGWFWFYIINEHVMRFQGKRVPQDYGQIPLLIFWVLAAMWIVPWTVFLPRAIREAARKLRRPMWHSRKAYRTTVMLIVWALVVLVFFSFSSRQEYYSLPALPALALMVGGLLARGDRENDIGAEEVRRSLLFAMKWLVLPACIAASVVTATLAFRAQTPKPGEDLFTALNQHPAAYTLSMGHLFDLTGASMGFFRVPLISIAIVMFLGSIGSYMLRRRRRGYASNLVLAAMACGGLLCAHLGLSIFYPILSSKNLALEINHVRRPGNMVLVDGEYTIASGLNFYTQQPIHVVNGRVNGLWYGSFWQDAPHIFETDESLHHLWQGPDRLFLLTTNPRRAADLKAFGPVYQFAAGGGKTLLTNQPD